MNAVIKIGGKQYLVSEGSIIYTEKLNANAQDTVTIDEVLMVDNKVGNPYVAGASVVGTVLKNGKNKKITVYKYKQKSNKSNRLKQGHRQPYTKIEITKING